MTWNDVIKIVDEQAQDEMIWFNAIYISESYLQKELRRLHAAVEDLYQKEVIDDDPG